MRAGHKLGVARARNERMYERMSPESMEAAGEMLDVLSPQSQLSVMWVLTG